MLRLDETLELEVVNVGPEIFLLKQCTVWRQCEELFNLTFLEEFIALHPRSCTSCESKAGHPSSMGKNPFTRFPSFPLASLFITLRWSSSSLVMSSLSFCTTPDSSAHCRSDLKASSKVQTGEVKHGKMSTRWYSPECAIGVLWLFMVFYLLDLLVCVSLCHLLKWIWRNT